MARSVQPQRIGASDGQSANDANADSATVTPRHNAGLPRRMPIAARFLPQRWFYGWYIAVASAVLMFVSVGVGYYGLAVFLRPLRDTHGWSNAAVSGATGLYFTVSGITGAVLGPRIDRRGPLQYQFIGVVLLGGSVMLVGLVEQLWQLYAVYVVLAVGFGMSTAVSINAILSRWFVHRRALAMSISSTGVSAGGMVLAPLGTALIASGGIELAATVMGLLILAVGPVVVVGVMVFDPAQMGLAPDNGVVPTKTTRESLGDAVQHRVWTRSEASRTLAFWAILVGFVLVLMAQTGFLLHQISFLEVRLGSAEAAAVALSITAFGSIVARLIVGIFADGVDKRLLTVALFVIQGFAVLGVVMVEGRWITYALVLIVGFTIGNIYMMQALLVGETFGMVSFGTVFGLVALAGQTGSGLGPFMVGLLEDATGGYTVPFVVTAALTFVAAGAVGFAKPPAGAAPLDGKVASLDSNDVTR